MKVLDLFSGLGGFSEAFVRAGDEVKRVENNPLLNGVPFTDEMCVLELRDILTRFKNEGHWFHPVDVILASPPCNDFSLAFSAPQAIASRNGEFENYEPDMTLVEATIDIINLLQPRYWIIENVMGSIRHFKKIGLEPHQIHGAAVLYGKFPKFSTPNMPTKKEKDTNSKDPLRSNKRALIPIELSSSIRKAIFSQKTLLDDYNIP
tara:strand:+ start:326 stop:943 length:618 start_codon:yes stop_codon:yes gene_type:complete